MPDHFRVELEEPSIKALSRDDLEVIKKKPAAFWSAADFAGAARGGAARDGFATAEQIADAWSDRRYLAARRLRSQHAIDQLWTDGPRLWMGFAERAGARETLTSWISGHLMDPYSGDRSPTDEQAADAMAAPAGSRSAKIVVGLLPGSTQIPMGCKSLVGFAREKFSAAQRKALEKAFASNSLDVAASLSADSGLEAGAAGAPLKARACAGAEGWFVDALTRSARGSGGAIEQTRWAVSMARAWARQEPKEARERIEAALARAAEEWRWICAPKKSAPGDMTPAEKDFSAIADRAALVAEVCGAKLPAKIEAALADIAGRREKIKKDAAQQQTELAADGQKSSAKTERWTAEKTKARQNVLLAAVDNLDFESIRWLLGEGGMTGDRLIFSRGTARGGLVDSLCSPGNWGDEKRAKDAAHGVRMLSDAGLDFMRECKAPGGKKHANPLARGVSLMGIAWRGIVGSELINALALAQVKSSAKAGMALSDVQAWRDEAASRHEVARLRAQGLPVDAYFETLTAGIEQLALTEGLGLSPARPASETKTTAAEAGKEPAAAPARRAPRL